jgi:hypothetical protein
VGFRERECGTKPMVVGDVAIGHARNGRGDDEEIYNSLIFYFFCLYGMINHRANIKYILFGFFGMVMLYLGSDWNRVVRGK